MKKLDKNTLKSFAGNKLTWLGAGIILIVIIISSITGFGGVPPEIPTYKVNRDNFEISLTESGELRAKNSITITAPRIRGNLKIIYMIPEGSYVKPGEVVAKFDATEAINSVRESESLLEIALSEKDKLLANQKSEVAVMESQLKSAELSFELSKLNLEQMKFEAEAKQQEAKLQHQKNELSYKQTRQEYESKKIIRQSELNKMELEIRQKRNDLEKAKKELDEMTLTAPAEGLVVYSVNWGNNGRKFSIGDNAWGGAVIMTLPDLSSMESLTYVNEVDVSKVKAGLPVKVKLDAFQDSAFTGEISDVAKLGKNKDGDSQIKVFEITVQINETSQLLKPGMTTSNNIIINEIRDVLFIPHEAVFDKDEKKVAYVLKGSGFDKKELVLGERGENFVVVKSGISDGDVVALRDPTISIENGEDEEDHTPDIPNS